MYHNGEGVKQDEKAAFKWYTEAAHEGHVKAQYHLGLKYYYGEGTEQDYQEAFKWFSKASNKGHIAAKNRLGLMYYQGKGVKKDYQKAFEWFTKAEQEENPSAQYNLGLMYYYGKGVKRDYQKAFEWLTKAATQDHIAAQNRLGLMYNNGEGVEQDYQKAIVWYTKAANQGDVDAQYNLGLMYYKGEVINQDYQEAGNGQNKLGFKHYHDKDIKQQDYQKAFQWYTKAAQQEDSKAQYKLGLMYCKGEGVEQDYPMAIHWLTKAVQQGDTTAQNQLGLLLQLTTLNTNSSELLWKGFFKDLGAIRYWRKIQARKVDLDFNLEKIKTIDLNLNIDQANHVLAGALRYIIRHQLPVKSLSILGGNTKNKKIDFFPSSISQLTSLQKLDLSYNMLSNLPTSISQLTQLKILKLSTNKFKTLPNTIRNLTGLQKLILAHNLLQTLPPWIEELTRLKKLNLSNNQLQALPDTIIQLYNSNNLSIDLSGDPLFKPNRLYPFTEQTLRGYAYSKLPHSLRTLCANAILEYTGKKPTSHKDVEESKEEGMLRKTFHVLRKIYPLHPSPQPTDPIFKEVELQKVLPRELWLKNLYTLIEQECEGGNQAEIVFFKSMHEQEVPLYLSYQLCTSKDVKAMLKKVKESKLKPYLVIP